jgi:hypothetical protein
MDFKISAKSKEELILKEDVFRSEFTQKLNLEFKNFIEKDEHARELNNFETAVLFVIKKKDQHTQMLVLEQAESIKMINDELNNIKLVNKQLEIQVDEIGEKLIQILQKKRFQKISKPKNSFCCII